MLPAWFPQLEIPFKLSYQPLTLTPQKRLIVRLGSQKLLKFSECDFGFRHHVPIHSWLAERTGPDLAFLSHWPTYFGTLGDTVNCITEYLSLSMI